MERKDLELANTPLLIENITKEYSTSDCDRIREALALLESQQADRQTAIVNVASLLVEQKADAVIVICALLAPLLWNKSLSLAEIRQKFGGKTAGLLSHFTLPPACRTDSEDHRHRDTQALLSTLSHDIHETLLLLAFRVIDLEEHREGENVRLRKKAEESLDILVPIANRLNLARLRRRLEDASFRILEPRIYRELERQVAPIREEDAQCLAILKKAVDRLLEKNEIKAIVQGRIKSIYGIYCKMMRKRKSFHDILDRIGMRIIVSAVPDCYTVLGLLHTHFQPVPGSFDDYIGLPKDNGYQSIHTCVYPVRNISHKPIEFQIRTELMHREAEYGVAAHWQYKQGARAIAESDLQKTLWMKGLVKQHLGMSSDRFINVLHQQVYEDATVVFGKGGRISRVPANATVADYLKRANLAVSPRAVVQVNGKPVGMEHVLQDGDSIEIIEPEGSEKEYG
jgi:(p)ppGpp synthase/HD superfamily hydrolase